MNSFNEALQLATSQGGVIRRNQANACGISGASITRRVRNGEWRRVARGVYRILDMDAPFDRVRAAIAALPAAVASHETAAELHAIPRLRRGLAVVTVHSKTTHSFPGVTVHRTRDLRDSHQTIVSDIPVTTVCRTVVDLSGQLHPRHFEAIVDDLVAERRLDLDELGDLVVALARRGKAGSTVLRDVIGDRDALGIPFASRLERLGLGVLLDAGLPRPKIEYPTPWDSRRRLDAAYPEARVGIEWDSRRWHEHAAAFQRDRLRDRYALLHGWRVFRFTWQDVTDRPYEVAATVRLALGMA